MRSLALPPIIALLLWPSLSAGCSNWYRRVPHPDLLPEYTRIVKGEVVGIRLTEYEERRKALLADGGEDVIEVSDSTPNYHVRVLVTKTYIGEESDVLELELGGCGVDVPIPETAGFYFFHPELGVQVVYESADPRGFAKWRTRLKRKPPK